MLEDVLIEYGIRAKTSQIKPLGAGLINSTWKVDSIEGQPVYVLQRINQSVFKSPEAIAQNLMRMQKHVLATQPGYLFVAPLETRRGDSLVKGDGEYFRLFPFIPGSKTFTAVSNPDHAFEAARQFGRFSSVFASFDTAQLQTTIPDFHNLEMRFRQFRDAVKNDNHGRSAETRKEIDFLLNEQHVVETYSRITQAHEFLRRATHHDTKISNVLFDNSDKGMCVIDLDTTMPGLFISDVGDMMRTYLSDSSEEEKDLGRVEVRPVFFEAVSEGYLGEMRSLLSKEEMSQFIYSGYFLIYMQALRFLADYLNGDIYYSTTYEGQNLVRTRNQIRLYESYRDREVDFRRLLSSKKFY